MNSNPHIEQEAISVQRFMWSDGNFKLPAGELLGTLLELLNTQHQTTRITDGCIYNYLLYKGYITDQGDSNFSIRCSPRELEQLGRMISKYIDDMIASLPPGTVVSLAPSILTHKPE